VRRILKSDEVATEVLAQAARVRDAIQDSKQSWEVDDIRVNKNRVVAEVSTMNTAAHWSEAESGRISAIMKGLAV
jgi:hypothetical protein